METKHPCKGCVVDSMCNESCEVLVEWLVERSKGVYPYCTYVADKIRQKVFYIDGNLVKNRRSKHLVLFFYD